MYDGDALIAEYDGSGNLLRRYVHGPGIDEPLLWYEGPGLGSRRHLRADHQGSVIAVADASGSSVAINTFDEYGQPGTSNLGRFQYTGQVLIPELGLYYYKARMYSAEWGRFLQTDPIGYSDNMNMYAYVGNDPMNFNDPYGLCDVENGKLANCTVIIHDDLTSEQRAAADAFVENLITIGTAAKEYGDSELQTAFQKINTITMTNDVKTTADGEDHLAAASVDPTNGDITVWRNGVDPTTDRSFLIQAVGHEVEHMTERDRENFEKKREQGQIGRSRAEVQTDIRAIGWLQKYNVLPTPYTSQSGYTGGMVFPSPEN